MNVPAATKRIALTVIAQLKDPLIWDFESWPTRTVHSCAVESRAKLEVPISMWMPSASASLVFGDPLLTRPASTNSCRKSCLDVAWSATGTVAVPANVLS